MPRGKSESGQRIYLDYAATTPLDPRVLKVMQPYFTRFYGNPGSLHSFGQEAIAAVDDAREEIAALLGCPPVGGFRQVIFTGSATEANNLALKGAVAAARTRVKEPKIIVSETEHESVLETARALFEDGVEVVKVPVGRDGRVDPADIERALDPRTVLVSVMYAQNETGTVQDVRAIGAKIADFRAARKSILPLFHTDAVQAFQFLDCRPDELGADLMTLSAHKVYGPKGVGVLFVRDPEMLVPVLHGGGQEFGLRSGTENVPLIAGAAEALRLADLARAAEKKRLEGLSARFSADLRGLGKKITLNGVDINGDARIPNILNFRIPGVPAERLLTELDLHGIAVSAGSACASRSHKISYVLTAMGLGEEEAGSSIRMSFGRPTSPAHLSRALAVLRKILKN